MRQKLILLSLLAFLASCSHIFSEQQPQPFDEEKARAASRIADPEQATRAYLDAVPSDRRQKTKSYAHGNYLLNVADFIFSGLVLIGLLGFGISAKMRDAATRLTRVRAFQTFFYWVQFLIITTLVAFPLTLYRSYFREKAYGLLTQGFGDWMIDFVKGIGIAIVLGGLFVMLLYGVLRKAPRTWWLWASAVMVAFIIFTFAIAPVFIQPLFNKFTPLQNAEIRESILKMAHDQGIPAEEVYQMDASKRTDRISAYVAGLLGTMRIVMFDNTLRRCTPEEIQMIMGHEMGHYVLNHIWKLVVFLSVLILLAFLLIRWAFQKSIRRWPSWKVEGIGDNAGFPLLVLLLSVVLFLTGPITNTWSRTLEDHADDFGLDASGYPDAAATTFLKLGEYRDLEPHPVIEFLLYDHPSGRYRIRNAMEWKASH